jgi:hypothetical protein
MRFIKLVPLKLDYIVLVDYRKVFYAVIAEKLIRLNQRDISY